MMNLMYGVEEVTVRTCYEDVVPDGPQALESAVIFNLVFQVSECTWPLSSLN
jgi:hypothetical protein